MTTLTRDHAEVFARIALGHVGREYPNKMDHAMSGPADVLGPRALHPIFFGSFDWHSCVHGYWLLARLVRRHPSIAAAARIAALLEERITPENVAAERAYLDRPQARGFERPYGWAWMLTLQNELELHAEGPCHRAGLILQPLAEAFAARFRDYLALADYPVRTGAHTSSAFALRLLADYTERNDHALYRQARERALSWYGDDRSAQAWEPGQDDFLSPTLMEAECMRRYMTREAFRDWFSGFLPLAGAGEPATLFASVRVSDRSDGKIAHLDGLMFSRAWCWRAIAQGLDAGDPATQHARDAAGRFVAESLPRVVGDYMGEHWLATYATLALDLL
ncbi:MAG: DUF2891 domain-containing protein [Hyphomonadaceae bacterium]|nr:MAG: hypothetical protein FD160_1324 [Caulobacteraceae bacterium]MBT9446233.1 DUF2891 domain-containing protein [Hyphomonadaceae bacterium]TPW07182.1 MAG: hypothetical protein FD124_1327 [Alphaproteobacteria bacterium]